MVHEQRPGGCSVGFHDSSDSWFARSTAKRTAVLPLYLEMVIGAFTFAVHSHLRAALSDHSQQLSQSHAVWA